MKEKRTKLKALHIDYMDGKRISYLKPTVLYFTVSEDADSVIYDLRYSVEKDEGEPGIRLRSKNDK